MSETRPEAAVVAELAKKAQQVELIQVEEGQVLSLPTPNGHERKVIDARDVTDKYLEKPRRAVGTAKLTTVDSFVAHAKRFKGDDTLIFADSDPESPSLLAVYDYHHATTDARHCQHRAKLELTRSRAWCAWTEAAGRTFNVREFAEFLEDRIGDVREPVSDKVKELQPIFGTFASPQKLLDLKDGLSVRVDASVTNIQKLSSGEGTMTFTEDHKDKDGGALKVPGAFLVGIPVFEGDALYELAVRLRYSLRDGRVLWRVLIHNTERVFEHAFEQVVVAAKKGTELPVLLGSPE